MPVTYIYLQLFDNMASQLRKPLANIADARNSVTFDIIPITSCSYRNIFHFLFSIHRSAWLLSSPIWLIWCPVCVVWSWVVVPVEVFCCISFQPDPNLFQWCLLFAKIEDKVVLLSAVYLHQSCATGIAAPLSVVPRRDASAHHVTVAVKSCPAIRTRFT